jgi:hypothetical protein
MASSFGRVSFLIRASFSTRGSAFSRVWRSARISSVVTVSMSLPGFTDPSTWVTSASSNTRVTWQIASASRMLARNALPIPSPWEAPFTMPAMSTKLTVAGMIFSEPYTSASLFSRGSGTPTTPTFGSIVANG